MENKEAIKDLYNQRPVLKNAADFMLRTEKHI